MLMNVNISTNSDTIIKINLGRQVGHTTAFKFLRSTQRFNLNKCEYISNMLSRKNQQECIRVWELPTRRGTSPQFIFVDSYSTLNEADIKIIDSYCKYVGNNVVKVFLG